MENIHLENYLRDLLLVDSFQDYAPNGIQIEGKKHIQKIATAVTASYYAIQKAVEWGADALMVHHGYFWKGEAPQITSFKKKRIALLMQYDINLFAYHLPLDAFPLWGNNAFIAKTLEIEVDFKKNTDKSSDLLWIGDLQKPLKIETLVNLIDSRLNTQAKYIDVHSNKIKKLAWCSGAAQDLFEKAIDAGVDAFVTGEYSERNYHMAKEANVYFIAMGHHASERGGIQSLGLHLEKEFHLEHFFIDEKNPF
jgi:dinuclear metal center YbgI/SA1388 family protein